MRFRESVLVLLCACALSACSHTSDTRTYPAQSAVTPTATPDAFGEVRAIYAKECQNCHAADGTGGKVKLEDGKTLRVPTFREGHALRHTDSDFRLQLIEGGDGMPSFKVKLAPQQIDQLIRFIRQEFQPGHTPPAEKSGAEEKKAG